MPTKLRKDTRTSNKQMDRSAFVYGNKLDMTSQTIDIPNQNNAAGRSRFIADSSVANQSSALISKAHGTGN